MSRRVRTASSVVAFLGALLLALVLAVPFLWMISISLQPDATAVFRPGGSLLPLVPRFQNYPDAIARIQMGRLFQNTMLLVVSNMAIGISASILVAYGFARFRARASASLFYVLLATMMLPWVVTMVPAYVLFLRLGWLGTFLPLIAPSIGGSAFYVFMLRQTFLAIPRELDEAAFLDGCGRARILWSILLPQCKPILATLVIFSFSGTWSDFVGPSIYLTDPKMHTLSIGLQYFRSTMSVMPWQLVMAACTLFAVPMVVVMFSAQNAFTRGIVTTGLK